MCDLVDMMDRCDPTSRLHVLTSNYQLPSLLARGVLFADVIENTVADLDDAPEATQLTVFVGRAGAEDLERIRSSARNSFPIALRLKENVRPKKFVVASKPNGVEYILLEDLDVIVFASEREAKLFQSWRFSNYQADPMVMGIETTPDLFSGEDASASGVSKDTSKGDVVLTSSDHQAMDLGQSTHRATKTSSAIDDFESKVTSTDQVQMPEAHAGSSDLPSLLRRGECAAALVSAYLSRAPAKAEWLDDWASTFRTEAEGPICEGISRLRFMLIPILQPETKQFHDLDSVLLSSTVRVLGEYPLSAGWPSMEILERIVKIATGYCHDTALESVERDIHVFHNRAQAVLSNKVSGINLSDDPPRIVRRSILLMLLRGQVDAVERSALGSQGSPLALGQSVKALALCLVAMRTGLHALLSGLKSADGPENSKRLLSVLGSYLVAVMEFAGSETESSYPVPNINVRYKPISEFDGEWIHEIQAHELRHQPSERDPTLLRLVALSQHLGFVPRRFGARGFEHAISVGNQTTKVIRVELLNSTWRGTPVVRFWSQVVSIGRGGKRTDEHVVIANRRALSKNLFSDLLKLNSLPTRHVRIALSDDEKSIFVIVDQLLSTLDDDEYRFNAECVAKEATKIAKLF